MFIINYEKSPLRSRRYRIYLINGEHIDIGFKKSEYFIDNGDIEFREFYYDLLNKKQKKHLMTCDPSQLLYETFILNGATIDIVTNINFYNQIILESFLN
jgi:hypothetical protein